MIHHGHTLQEVWNVYTTRTIVGGKVSNKRVDTNPQGSEDVDIKPPPTSLSPFCNGVPARLVLYDAEDTLGIMETYIRRAVCNKTKLHGVVSAVSGRFPL